MTTKLARGLLACAALGVAGWVFRDAIGLRGMAPARQATSVRKCVAGAQVLYSDGACPAGSRETTTGGGTVTVLPALRVQPGGGAASKPLPNVRDLLVDPQAADLKDKRMEEVIGK
jgi:hypothetical protein